MVTDFSRCGFDRMERYGFATNILPGNKPHFTNMRRTGYKSMFINRNGKVAKHIGLDSIQCAKCAIMKDVFSCEK